MPVPTYDQLMVPFLETVQDGRPWSTREVAEKLAERFNLSEEERNSKLPSGIQTYLLNRTGWAGFHLSVADLISKPKRGFWQITDAGRQLLQTKPAALNRESLMRIPAFQRWYQEQHKAKRLSEGASETASNNEIDLPPDELMAKAYKTLHSKLKEELLSIVHRMDPVQFERLVLDLLLVMRLRRFA